MDEIRVEPGELEVFFTLVEETHFGRTAERLHLSQPRVSQLLRSLERRIGGRLFERTSRRVTLTPLGARLLKGARPAFDELVHVLTDVRAIARGLRLGFIGPYIGALDRPRAAFRERHPDCPITLVQLLWTDIYGPLRRGEIDLQACLSPVEQDDLRAGPAVAAYPRVLAIARSHPLAGRSVIDVEALAELTVVQPNPDVPSELQHAFWPPAVTPAGRPIPVAGRADTEQEMLAMVAHGDGVFVTTEAMPHHFSNPGVAFVPFTGMPDAQIVLVRRADNQNHKITEFIELATR